MVRKLAPGTFFGERQSSFEVEGFRLSEWSYEPERKAPRHAHEFAYLNMVLQGGHLDVHENGELGCEPFVLVFHPVGEVHSGQIYPSPTRIFDIEIAPQRLQRIRELAPRVDRRAVFEGGLPVWLATRLFREFECRDEVSPLVIEGIALELLAEAVRRPAPTRELRPPRWLRQARDLLHSRFDESLSLEELARAVGIHPDHLAHSFRRHYGCSVGEYVRGLRVDFACRRLTSTGSSLAEIACTAGFADQSHFTRTFKRLIGMTPSEFQRRFAPSLIDPKG